MERQIKESLYNKSPLQQNQPVWHIGYSQVFFIQMVTFKYRKLTVLLQSQQGRAILKQHQKQSASM